MDIFSKDKLETLIITQERLQKLSVRLKHYKIADSENAC
jgi:hypothetical protein